MIDYTTQARQEIVTILLALLVSIVALWRSKDIRSIVIDAFLHPAARTQRPRKELPELEEELPSLSKELPKLRVDEQKYLLSEVEARTQTPEYLEHKQAGSSHKQE